MTDINKVFLVGRLTKDSELKYTSGGFAIGNFSIALNRSVKKNNLREDEVSFFEVTFFGKIAENLQRYLTKGKQVAIEGILKQDRWQDNGGINKSKVVIIAEQIQLLGMSGNTSQQPITDQSDFDNSSIIEKFNDEIPF